MIDTIGDSESEMRPEDRLCSTCRVGALYLGDSLIQLDSGEVIRVPNKDA
jgi:hypothetical protein